MQESEEVNDRAVWWDVHLDAAAWYRTETVTPMQAALLMAGHNPNRKRALEAAQLDAGAGIGPDDFQRLLSVLEGVDPNRYRSLPDWIAYASARGLPMHPWVEEFHEMFVSAYVISPVADNSGEIPPSQKKRLRWDHREYSDLLSLSIQPGMTQQKLADLYGVSRSFIGRCLKIARSLGAPRQARWDNALKRPQTKK
jgi:hypothetical protein